MIRDLVRPLPFGEIIHPLGRLYVPPLSLAIKPLDGVVRRVPNLVTATAPVLKENRSNDDD